MIYYKIGCNFDLDLLEGIKKLNDVDPDSQINEIYGSDRRFAFLTGRPSYRVPDIDKPFFKKYLSKCNEYSIQFNYCLNTIYPGSKRFLLKNKLKIIKLVQFLEKTGVSRITIANPILAEIVREASNSIKIEISSIAHIESITQIRVWDERFNIDKICFSTNKNRSINFLHNAVKLCNKYNIVINLLVNEFCINGPFLKNENSFGTNCIYRDSCVLCHAENETMEDALLFNNYPMERCIQSRINPLTWLKALFIRPEDIEKYARIGINHFKITGRTGTTEYIISTAEKYIKKSSNGNLLKLWKPLESINSNTKEKEVNHHIFIDNKKLDNFIDFWFNNPDHECSNEICSETCNYCNTFYIKYLKTQL